MKKRVLKFIIIITLIFLCSNTIVKAKSNYLYDVLKDEAESGGLAKEYTGEHHDSFTEEPSKKVYHWYAANDTQGNQVLEKNNVIFANHCWQMIRTTDTGGVKMIYNGEVEDGKCLSTRETHVGYAYRTSQNLASNYWYGTDYTYDSTAKTFKVSGTKEQTMWNESNGPGLVGKYTCKSTSVDGTCATLYLVESYYNTTSAYVISLNSNSNYSQFGILQFNVSVNSPSYVGYMYNTVYPYNTKTMISSETMLSEATLSTMHWYAHDAIWGSPTASRYNLDSPYQVSTTTNYPNLVGEYTFRNTTQTYTNTSVYYIAAVNNTTMYYIQLQNSTNHNLADYNYTYTYGDSYTDNGDGTYTINSPTTVNRSDWYTSYSNVGANKYVCKNAVNDTCSELWYTTATSNTSMKYIKVANNYKYSKGFTWDGSKYVLDNDTSTTFFEWNDTNKTSINNAHYTCWNEMGECTTISYIYYIEGKTPYYINITNGKSVEDAKNEMLYDDNVNTINSTIKSEVDAWYKHYLLEDYDDYIEDTIFCNDRSIRALNGWNPDGGMTNADLQFKEYNVTSDLSCANTTDQFSISNNNAKLTYKVGLMSSPEVNILNNSNARKTGQWYWLASPYYFSSSATGRYVNKDGDMGKHYLGVTYGVRPAVSLKSSARAISGDGSTSNPYKLSFDPVYSVSTEIKNETKNLDISIEDMTQVEEGEKVTFKITPIDGYKLSDIKILDSDNNEVIFIETSNDNEYSFIMPPSNVTIKPTYKKVSNSVNIEDNNNTKEFIIEVNDSKAVVYEDTVKFTIIPEEGYEIEDIEIIDKNNNKIEYKKTSKDNEYSFTMPETDVIIKPIYKKLPIKENNNLINPLTNNKFIRTILLIILFFSIGIFLYRKKIKFVT